MQTFEQIETFQEALLSWYHEEKRDLPWRRTDNPYYIWISEVMLQQTRVEAVIPYYERFIEKFPTMQKLADATEEELLKMWEGLGYYSRARNLQSGVREVMETYGGVVPDTRKEISKLKGVGPYTAGAVLSIAYGVPEHAVDGNVMRVISRILLIEEDIALARNRKIFEEAVMRLMAHEDPSSFNQALMELGALICIPNPRCLLCPVRDFCAAFEEGTQEQLPVKSKKVKHKKMAVASFAIQDGEGRWLVRQRPSKGLLAGLWEFPMVELTDETAPSVRLSEETGIQLKRLEEATSFSHVFSHITWEMEAYRALLDDSSDVPAGYRLVTDDEWESLPKPLPVIKIWQSVQ